MIFSWLLVTFSLVHSLCAMETASSPNTKTRESGIYIVLESSKRITCYSELRMVIGKRKVCVSRKPIITSSQFEYVTSVMYNYERKVNYIDVGISSSALQTLNKMVYSLPHTQFAIVVEDDVVCLFQMEGQMDTRYIRVGEDADLHGLHEIANILKKLKL